MLWFCFAARINIRANGFRTGPTLEERFVFQVFWNFNSSIKTLIFRLDFSASEETAVGGGNTISAFL